VITLQEPPKQEMISFLEGELRGQSHQIPVRAARVQVTIRGNSKPNEMVELTIDLTTGSIIKKEHLVGKHPYIDSAYMQAAEKACRADPRIEAEIQKLKLPEGAQVVVEPWAYATDGMNDVSERTTMVRLDIFENSSPI
jgi:primary-amine oxidase